MFSLYVEWNAQINVISRKDMDGFYVRHVLHALAIAKYIHFQKGTRVFDVGTGGGFPGIPLAVFFPNVEFHLIDSIGKKIKVINAVAEALKLTNVITHNTRMEQLPLQADFVVCRAVAPMETLMHWVGDKIQKTSYQYQFIKKYCIHQNLIHSLTIQSLFLKYCQIGSKSSSTTETGFLSWNFSSTSG